MQIYFLSIMRQLAGNYRIKVILPENSPEKILAYLQSNQIEFEFFDGNIDLRKTENLYQRIKRRWNDFFCNLTLAGKLAQQKLDDAIVHIDAAPWSSFTLLFYLLFKTRIFVTFHTPLPRIAKWRRFWWQMKFGILANFENFYIVASNKKVKESLKPYLPTKKFQDIKIAYSSINLAEIAQNIKIQRSDIAARYDLPIDKFWLCNVGQFIERKGCWILLEALRELAKKRSDIYFYWLGTGALDQNILEKVNSYGLKDSFRFFTAEEIGRQRSDLLNFLTAADLFVMPSLEEGLPVALIEAMALEKCCIASDTDAIPEAVEHLETGFLIPPNNVQELKKAIEILLEDENLRQKLGKGGRNKVIKDFNDEKLGAIMLGLYEKALMNNATDFLSS